MRLRKLFPVAAILCGAALGVGSAVASPTIYPTGTTIYLPEQAYNGYVLLTENSVLANSLDPAVRTEAPYKQHWYNVERSFTAKRSPYVHLLDMNGNIVHTWKTTVYGSGNARSRLLPDGHLLHVAQFDNKVYEYDWDGNIVFQYDCDGTPHHDIQKLANGNYLILSEETIPAEYLAKLQDTHYNVGSRSGTIKRTDAKLIGDTLLEVTPKGEVIWKWRVWEHVDVNRASVFDGVNDWSHGNTCSIIPPNKHYDAGDARFKPGNIIFNPRNFDEFWIIDRESGKVVHTLNHDVRGGLAHPHEPYMIPKGIPGEGNILVFDNGSVYLPGGRGNASIVVEMDAITGKSVWNYSAPRGLFLAPFMASATKLPNGNVLISEDPQGRVFQVKPTEKSGGAIVWEYMHNSDLARTLMVPYDFTPQLRAMPKPAEKKVSPVDPPTLRILPDADRKAGATAIVPIAQ